MHSTAGTAVAAAPPLECPARHHHMIRTTLQRRKRSTNGRRRALYFSFLPLVVAHRHRGDSEFCACSTHQQVNAHQASTSDISALLCYYYSSKYRSLILLRMRAPHRERRSLRRPRKQQIRERYVLQSYRTYGANNSIYRRIGSLVRNLKSDVLGFTSYEVSLLFWRNEARRGYY